MHRSTRSGDSHWALVADLLSARVLVWIASVGRDADLRPDAHRYFFDRYSRLAEYHRVHRHPGRAARLQAKADAHYRPGPETGPASGGDGPPYAAAMAMPRPRRFVIDAVSRHRLDGPDDAA